MTQSRRQNQFESLRHPGIIGSVVSRDFNSSVIYQKGDPRSPQSITIYTGQLLPGRWAFGFHFLSGRSDFRILPGELSGWFGSQSDAQLYALEHVRTTCPCPEEAAQAIREAIYMLRNPTLF